MAYYKATEQDFESVANAIREKTGRSAKLEFPTEFVSEIGSISGGGGGDAMPPFKINVSGWIINGEIAKVGRENNTDKMYMMKSDWSDLTFDSTNSYKIGISVKMSSLANHAVIVNVLESNFASSVGIEFGSNGNVGIGIPGGFTTWADWIWIGQYSVDEWTYVEFEYKKELGKVICRMTNDFSNYVSEERELTPYGYAGCRVVISGWQQHNNGMPYIDFTNTFIESEGDIIWGKFTGAFPD